MSVFSKRPLGILDALYRFVGGQTGPMEFAEDAPIQPVHNLARQAELSGFGIRQGFWIIKTSQVHAGAGEIEDVIDVYEPGTVLNGWTSPLPNDIRAWFIDGFAWTDAASAGFVAAEILCQSQANLVGPVDASGPFNQFIPCWRADTASGITGQSHIQLFRAGAPGRLVAEPFRIEPTADMFFQSEASAAMTVNICARVWAGTVGATPPGLS